VDGPVRLVDGGAYVGDTVRAFVDGAIQLDSVVAFEPDPVNFLGLTRELSLHQGVDAIALPVALAESTGAVSFAAHGTAASSIATQGTAVVQCAALDDVLHGWRPTHVKLDLEGAEPAAIRGMKRLLRADRPRLAISVYHRPDHLWTLLLQLAAL